MGTSNRGTEDRTPVDIPCRLDPSKDVQLKTLAKIWQGSHQPNLVNKVMRTQQVWSATRCININIIINIIIIVTTSTILKLFFITVVVIIFIDIIITITIVIFIVKALCNICKKSSL
jgi:hypothetical protein